MLTEPYDEKDGRRVWLNRDEFARLLELVDDPMRTLAFRLGAECGLRGDEVVEVRPRHVVEDDEVGKMLLVPEGKSDYRETPLPEPLADLVEMAAGYSDTDPDEVLIDRTTRSLRNWTADVREALLEDTDEERWEFLTFHDTRRTWAGWLANADVDVDVALRWGGWRDLDTFLEHYRGEASARAQARERGKVDWL